VTTAQRIDGVAVPTPTDDDQRRLLQVVWDLFVSHSKWPTFAQVDRKLDQDFGLDVEWVMRRLPAELLYPQQVYAQLLSQEFHLTIAGVAACSGSQEDVGYFLEVVRFATELERHWPGRPTAETDEPILKSADVVQHVQFRAGRGGRLTRLGLLLAVEPWGWQQSAELGSPDWQFVLISRQVRGLRGVRDLDHYWSICHAPSVGAEMLKRMGAFPTVDQPSSIPIHRTKQPSPRGRHDKRGSMTTADKLFISHASADRKLADLLQDTLVLGGVPSEQIFYSSSRATGIPSGTDVRTYLRRELQQAGLVVELVSATFLTRPMCLFELGGAWALGKSTYPIVVPPLTRSEAVAKIGDIHMGQLSSDEEIDYVIDELHDRLTRDLGLSTKATAWNPVARRFKEGLPAVLAALTATPAPSAATPSAPPASASSRSPAKVTVDNYAVVPNGHGTEVQGEATNNDTVEHTAFLKATFYDEVGKIVGTADGAVNQLAPGDTKTFTLVSANTIQQYARLKVQVDAVY
jgi:hypothetical protein